MNKIRVELRLFETQKQDHQIEELPAIRDIISH
jgi:hypothetical protein